MHVPVTDVKRWKATGFEWWVSRIRNCYKLYDIIRIDHFRGFDEYYNIPYGDPTADLLLKNRLEDILQLLLEDHFYQT